MKKQTRTYPDITTSLPKFRDSGSANCRYGECAVANWGEWNVIWENFENNYQGHAKFLICRAEEGNKNPSFIYYSYTYGSCSGCDHWESKEYSDADVCKEMMETCLLFGGWDGLNKWTDMLVDATGAYQCPIIQAIQKFRANFYPR